MASKVAPAINGKLAAVAAYKEEGDEHHTAVTTAAVKDSRYWGNTWDTTEVSLNCSCYRLNARVFLSFLFNELILSNLNR